MGVRGAKGTFGDGPREFVFRSAEVSQSLGSVPGRRKTSMTSWGPREPTRSSQAFARNAASFCLGTDEWEARGRGDVLELAIMPETSLSLWVKRQGLDLRGGEHKRSRRHADVLGR